MINIELTNKEYIDIFNLLGCYLFYCENNIDYMPKDEDKESLDLLKILYKKLYDQTIYGGTIMKLKTLCLKKLVKKDKVYIVINDDVILLNCLDKAIVKEIAKYYAESNVKVKQESKVIDSQPEIVYQEYVIQVLEEK